jgi:uncharacterized coiled-coil protein SlyX
MRDMFKPAKVLLPVIGLLSLGACDQQPASPVAKIAPAPNPIEQDVKQMQYDIRLAAADKRIEELERQVGALDATPEKLDLNLLTQRVAELEANAGGAVSVPSPSAPATVAPRSNGSGKRKSNDVRKTSPAPSRLSLPSLERRPQIATPGEAKAFTSGK